MGEKKRGGWQWKGGKKGRKNRYSLYARAIVPASAFTQLFPTTRDCVQQKGESKNLDGKKEKEKKGERTNARQPIH